MSITTFFILIVLCSYAHGVTYEGPSRIEVQTPLDVISTNDDVIRVPERFTHSAGLSYDESVTVNWTPDIKNERVVWQVAARTLGWLGFGFSHNGGMDGADMITAWVKNGKLYIQDRHGVGNTFPPEDKVGNWQPLQAYENDTHTVITVSRNINTCDEQDFVLNNETVRIIYAWGADDPEGDDPPYHGLKRGARSAYVLLPPNTPSAAHHGLNTWRVSQEVTLPKNRDVFYFCHIEKVPELLTKHHYVGYGVKLGENAHTHVHHITLYECSVPGDSSQVFEQYVGETGHECYSPNMPLDFINCQTYLLVWGVGSEGYMFPPNVGLPMHEEFGGASYFMFEAHYDNPFKIEDLHIQWSMDMYYTDQLRENELGTLFMGHAVNFGLAIPPSQPDWLTVGHCSQHCTRTTIPETGVKAFQVLLHSHTLGRSMRLRHFRDGKELPYVAQDRNYDFNFQHMRTLKEELLILPGDHFSVECDYDSTGRSNSTFSGLGTRDEMCQAIMLIYPKVELSWCQSTPTVDTLRDAFDLHTIPRSQRLDDYTLTLKLEDGSDYQTKINEINWTPERIKDANEKLVKGTHYAKCFTAGNKHIEVGTKDTSYPVAIPYVPPVDRECKNFYRVVSSVRSSASAVGVSSVIPTVIGVTLTMLRG